MTQLLRDQVIGSWIDDHLRRRAAEEDIQLIENVAPQDSFAASEIRLHAARMFPTIEPDPYSKHKRCRGTSNHSANQALQARRRRKPEGLTVRPRQNARSSTGVGNDSKASPADPLAWRNSAWIIGNDSPA